MNFFIKFTRKSSQKWNNRSDITRRYHFNNTTAASTKNYKQQLALESGTDLTVMRAMTTKTTIAVAVFATIMWLSMILPISARAQGTFEDDGYTYDSDDPEEQQEQDEEEQQNYDDQDLPKYDEDTGTYNDDNNDGKDDDSDSDSNNQPYCDEVDNNVACYDRKDYDQTTGLYPCKDGSQVSDPIKCTDSEEYKDLPDCKNGVVKDCKVGGESNLVCTVGTTDDPCQDIYYGMTGGEWPECCGGDPNNDSPRISVQSQAIPPTPTPKVETITPQTPVSRTLFDLVNCKFYGAQDAVSGIMDQMSYTKCLTVGDGSGTSVYLNAYYDGVNNNDNGDSSSSQPQPTPTQNCDTWRYALDLKLAAQNATVDLLNAEADRLDAMYDKAITPEQIDIYNAQVDAHNARIDADEVKNVPLDAEVARWNAECAA